MSLYKDPPNPFRRLDYEQLHRACWDVRGRLAAKGPKTPDQRRQLAHDCEQLLQVLSADLFQEGPGHPAYMIRWHDQTIDAFADYYDIKRELLRARVLRRAAMVALGGPGADDWVKRFTYGTADKIPLRGESDAYFLEGLRQLEALRLATDAGKDGASVDISVEGGRRGILLSPEPDQP